MTYRGHIQNGAVVLDAPLSLPEGTPVLVEARPASPREILATAKRVYEGLSSDEVMEVEAIALDRRRFFDRE